MKIYCKFDFSKNATWEATDSIKGLFTSVDLGDPCTSFTFDKAAPLKLAVASLLHDHLLSVVASVATHQLAAVHPNRSPVANPSLSPEGIKGQISNAIIG